MEQQPNNDQKNEFPDALKQIEAILKEHGKSFMIAVNIGDRFWHTYNDCFFAHGACHMIAQEIDNTWHDSYINRFHPDEDQNGE